MMNDDDIEQEEEEEEEEKQTRSLNRQGTAETQVVEINNPQQLCFCV